MICFGCSQTEKENNDPLPEQALAKEAYTYAFAAVEHNKAIYSTLAKVASENGASPEELRRFIAGNDGMAHFADSLLVEATLAYTTQTQP